MNARRPEARSGRLAFSGELEYTGAVDNGIRPSPRRMRPPRYLVVVAAWLCLCISALPCALAAPPDCCPDRPAPETLDHSDHDHGHHPNPGSGASSGMEGHDCLLLEGGACCDAQALILEDRSPKLPDKSPMDLTGLATDSWADATACTTRVHAPAMGPPPGAHPGHARRLALLCSYLI